ncbi:hypothetical protein C8R46DRAFT_1053100 [Mycena filopes]|nr:hypothetical protein C8R46DRAFT_1053100 [Mycena filopes]
MRGTGTRARLPSIPEEDSVAVVSKQPAPAPAASKANAQHAGLGLGLPSALRQALRNQSSPKPTSAESTSPTPVKKWRLQSTVHELFSTRKFAKRPLFPIHEARSREASAETSGGVEEKGAGTGKERASSAATEQERRPSQRLQMSPAMLLAAQSILEEDKKFRRKEGLDKPKTLKRKQGGVPQPTSTSTLMSPTMRLASQVEEQMNQWKLQKQAGSGVQGTKNKKFLF